tara:strand:- start:4011 stop:4253 length:243 start_codon:yes stop_codon:yes gene_type:complete
VESLISILEFVFVWLIPVFIMAWISIAVGFIAIYILVYLLPDTNIVWLGKFIVYFMLFVIAPILIITSFWYMYSWWAIGQ